MELKITGCLHCSNVITSFLRTTKMEATASDSEKRPLLENTYPQKVDNDLKLGVPKPLALFLGISVVLFQFISYILSMYVMNQYSYQAYMKERYPNSTLNSTGSQYACNVNINSTEYKQQVVVQKLTSEWNIYCTLVSNVPGILFTVNLASFSDVYGRKLFFLAPLIGTFLKNALCAIGIYFNFNITYFIIFYAFEGCTGTWISTLSMVYCYIADLTEPGKPRTIVIGLLELGIGTGAFVSTTLSGYLIKWTDGFFYPLVASVSAVVLALMVVMFLLPESLPQSKRHNKVSIVQNFARVSECYKSNFSPLAKPWVFITLIVLFIASGFGNLGRLQVETLYQLNSPFCWDSVRIGWYGALRLGMLSAGGLAIIKIFHFFTTDEYIALAGCVTTVASCVMTGLANKDIMLYIGT